MITDTIAVVGMSARFPGAPNLDAYWALLREGREGIRRGLAGLAPDMHGLRAIDAFGVLDDIDRFDNRLFRITAREAAILDPQHRIWLELVWHALEDAGLGQRSDLVTGVFAGCNRGAYLERNIRSDDGLRLRLRTSVSSETRQILNGNEREFLPLRTSYVFGFDGPSVNVQTACSTALVATALACNALAFAECDVGIAGAVSIARTTDEPIFAEPDAIHSRTGQCRPFDASADGAVFGDGGGVVVLRRLQDAIADGHRVYAVIRGWGITNDGGAKASFAAPNARAQARAISTAWAMAGVDAGAVSYVEAHGTGTRVGDPIEFEGLRQSLGDAPGRCWIGSVKSNIGHIDTAAGIAGLIKTAMMLRRRTLVPTVRFEEPNPLLGLERSRFRIVRESMPWGEPGDPLWAGVTALGVGGTNCHLALSVPPDALPQARGSGPGADRPVILTISARTRAALERQIKAHAEALPTAKAAVATYCEAAAVARRHLDHRVALCANDPGDLAARLREKAAALAETGSSAPRIAFAFCGQLSSNAGMARGLYECDPIFRRWISECAHVLDPLLGRSLADIMFYGKEELARTEYEQPVLCALQIALAETWKALDLRPTAVLGYSVGEFAAAHCAGAVSLEDVLSLVARRGRLMGEVPAAGFMMSVLSPAGDLQEICERAGVNVAAEVGPNMCIVSGPGTANAARRALEERGCECRELTTRYGFHSAWLSDCLEDLSQAAERVAWSRPGPHFVSTVTGRIETEFSGRYWSLQARERVRFGDTLAAVRDAGCDLCLEIGPGGILRALAANTDVELSWLQSLDRNVPDGEAQARCLADLYEAGAEISWRARYPDASPGSIDLPKYAFEPSRFWIGAAPETNASPDTSTLEFKATWSATNPAYLDHHRLFGTVVVPASHHVAWTVSTIANHFGSTELTIDDWQFIRPMVIADGSEIHVQMTLRPHSDSDGRQGYAVEISRILEQERELCVTARLAFGDRLAADTLGISEIAPAGDFPAPTDGASFYRDVWAPGEDTGTMFRRIRQVWRKAHHAVADIVACEAEAGEALTAPIIEAGFQCLHAGSAIESATERNVRRRLWVPYAIDRVAYRRPNTPLKWCRAIHHPELRSENAAVATITLYDGAGDPALEVAGFHLRPLHEQALRQGKRDDGVYRNVLDRANLAPVDRGGVAGQLVLAIDAAVGTHDERNALCKGFPGEPVVLPLDDPAACAAMLDGSLHCRRLSVAFIAPGGADGIDLRPAGRLLELARILAERGADIKAFAVCTLWHDDVPSPAAAAIEGLARVMMNEYPDWGVRLVSHEMSAASAERARQICTEISLGEAGEQVVYRDGERYRRTLLPFALPRRGARLRGDRSYLVVGESDEQIGLLAKWLSENGAGRVEIAEFGDMGQDLLDAEVRPVGRRLSADASGLAKRLVEREGSCPIAGVFFLPWGTSDESLELKSLEGLVAEAADCLDFLTALASACETVPLDHFVCFSSSAAVLGTRGQGSYAALTSAIDALCADRRRRGLAGLSVNWGPWLDVGRWTRSAAAVRAVSRQGWTLLDPVEALSLMGRAMAGEEPVVSVIRVRWGLLAGSGAIDGIRLLAGATSSGAKGPEPDVGRSATDEMAELIGEQLGETPGSTLLVELGLDSLMAVKLRNTLKRTHGVDIPLAHLLAKTTLSDLAELDARRNAAKKVGSTAVMNVGGGAA